jgi:iron(II)-dependent oxidoreductase
LQLIADLGDEQLMGPRLDIINPLLWEIGHLAWFQEKWVLRRGGRPSLRPDADALYDSSAVPHATRWDLPLPTRANTLRYLQQVQAGVLEQLRQPGAGADTAYFVQLSVFHEDMHAEALTYTRQTLGYPPPVLPYPTHTVRRPEAGSDADSGPWPGDVSVPGGRFLLGALPGESFVFDNEKWVHPVELRPFAIARAPVTQAEFAGFVEEAGYERPELWDDESWRWCQAAGARHPVYWQRQSSGWWRRDFDRWVPLEPHRPVLHVNWHEAQAYCRWARRRLPTEAEWEAAASTEPAPGGGELSGTKRRFPWGDSPPAPAQANLDGSRLGCVDVAARGTGDSPSGCRQLIGNVWEWTASEFLLYPGFVVDPYQDYSRPWFGTHKVLRGGCWVTRGRVLRNTWRNFYRPERRDVWAGFRTCALAS